MLLASIALALPATAFVASNYQSHTPRAIQASLANAPFDHIVTVMLENQGLCSVYVGCGGSGTYESQLADQNVLANTWGTINHNSEPNYIALLGAINDGSTSNDGVCCYFETTPNLIDRIESGGLTWQAFAEDAGSSGTCSFSPPRSGDHFPFIDFSDINTASRCSHFLTTASSTDAEFLAALNTPNPANFIWLTPNDNDNGHDTGVSGADSYLSALVPKILSSTEFTTTKATLLLLYDEGYSQCTNTGGTGECLYASFSGPTANKGVQISPAGASHYSYLSTIEVAWGLPSINSNDAGAPNMLAAFATSCTTNCPPPPLSTSFTASPSTPLVNVQVIFTATTTGGTAPYAYSWSFGDGATSTGQNPSHNYSSLGTYTVTLTVTDASSPQQKATVSKTLTITVRALNVSFTFTPSSPQVNSLVTFTGSGSGGVTPYVYSWTFGDGQTASGANATHTYTTAGTFTVTLTLTDAANTQVISTQSLTIASLPIAPSFTVSTNPTEVNLPVSFSATASGGTLPYVSFSWNFGDGSAPGSGSTVTHAYASAGTFSVTVTVTDSAGKTGTSAAQSLVVNANLAVSAITASPNPANTGQTITFIATTSGGVAPLICNWNFGDGATGTGCSTNQIYGTAGNFTATVTVTDSLGVAISESIAVKITAAPQCTVSLVFGPATPEATSPVTFTASTTNCIAPVSFAWSFGDGSTGSGVTAVHIYSTSETFSVSVTATDSSSPSQIATSSKSITVLAALAVPSITASPNPNDAGAPSSFSASIYGGVGAVSCNWTFGDGTSITGCSTTHAYSNPGTFMVVVTAQDSLGVAASKTVSEVIDAQPNASFTIVPTSPEVNESVTLTATTAGGTNPFTFSWNFGDSTSASGNIVSHTYSSAGSYTVTLTAKDANVQTVTSTQTLLVAPSPLTTIFVVASSSGLTVGQPASFTASVSGGTSPYTFNWNFGDGTTASGNPVNHSFNMPGTYTVTVTVADANAKTATATASILVNPPTLAVTISGPTTGTAGSAVTFTATGTGGTTPYAFAWTSTAGSPASATGASFSTTYSTIGTFIVSATITDANANVSIASQNVTIVALPISANFTVSTSPTIGVPVTFVASTSGGTGGYSYSWNFGDSSTATGNPASHTYTTAGSLTVTLTVTDSSMTQTTIAQIITVSPSTPMPFSTSFTMSSTSAQAGQPVVFSATASGGTSPYVYLWNFGDSSVLTGNPVSHSFAAGNYTVSLTVNDSSVPSETAVASQTFTITTVPLTVLIPSSQTVNEGSPLTFNVSATGDPSRTISIACDNCLALGAAFTTNGGLGFSSGNFTWTPSAGQGSSTYLVRMSASDGALVVSANVSIFVNEVIEQPVLIVLGTIHVSQGEIIHFMVNQTDPDNAADNVTLAASGLPNGASFDPSTGIFNWNVSSVQPGPYVITFTATSDGLPALQDSKTVTIHVDNGNGNCHFCNFFLTARSVLHASTLPTNPWLLLVGGIIGLTATLAAMTRRASAQLRASRRKVRYHKEE